MIDPETNRPVKARVLMTTEMGGKFGNRTTVYAGQSYHSAREARYAAELDLRLRGKDIKGWERQISLPMKVGKKLICRYIIDFVIEHKDGSKEYVEVKGFETDTWKLKWKLFEALYPNVRKTIVK